jgi:hypothetical protein
MSVNLWWNIVQKNDSMVCTRLWRAPWVHSDDQHAEAKHLNRHIRLSVGFCRRYWTIIVCCLGGREAFPGQGEREEQQRLAGRDQQAATASSVFALVETHPLMTVQAKGACQEDAMVA